MAGEQQYKKDSKYKVSLTLGQNYSVQLIHCIFSHLTELKCLFLQNNRIEWIENLDSCILLNNLNLANNYISKLVSG